MGMLCRILDFSGLCGNIKLQNKPLSRCLKYIFKRKPITLPSIWEWILFQAKKTHFHKTKFYSWLYFENEGMKITEMACN